MSDVDGRQKRGKKERKPLKLIYRIVLYFLLVTAVLALVTSIFDGVMNRIMISFEPLLDSPSADSKTIGMAVTLIIVFIVVSLLIYVFGGVWFYFLIRRSIDKDNQRRFREQNLIYASIAHDLKTPITSIQGFSQALSEGRIKPEEQKEICDIIYHKSRGMNELVDVFAEYANLGSDEFKLRKTEFDICALAREIVADNYSDFEDHGIELDIDIPEDGITIEADRGLMSRAMTNLTVNSYKHNPDGIKVLIKVADVNDESVDILIADTGSRIPEGMDVFEPFVTENKSRTPGHGSGLGLAITKRVIELHDGTIDLISGYGDYEKAFRIRLPKKTKF